MLVDPFINGVAEFHDRHRAMRLDVDNMSYEVMQLNFVLTKFLDAGLTDCFVRQELLALEERIGNVNTGLSEETISVNMKQRKHGSLRGQSSSNLEPCCICQVRILSDVFIHYQIIVVPEQPFWLICQLKFVLFRVLKSGGIHIWRYHGHFGLWA